MLRWLLICCSCTRLAIQQRQLLLTQKLYWKGSLRLVKCSQLSLSLWLYYRWKKMLKLQQRSLRYFTEKMSHCSLWVHKYRQNVFHATKQDCGMMKSKRFIKELRLPGNIEITIWNFRLGSRRNMAQKPPLRKDMPGNLWVLISLLGNQLRLSSQHWSFALMNARNHHSHSRGSTERVNLRDPIKLSAKKNCEPFLSSWKSIPKFSWLLCFFMIWQEDVKISLSCSLIRSRYHRMAVLVLYGFLRKLKGKLSKEED